MTNINQTTHTTHKEIKKKYLKDTILNVCKYFVEIVQIFCIFVAFNIHEYCEAAARVIFVTSITNGAGIKSLPLNTGKSCRDVSNIFVFQ